jgi:hypothetical protein
MEQQNIDNHKTKNDTFIDRDPSSLASLRGKPLAERNSITIILKHETFSCLLILFILILSSKEHYRGRYF